MNEISPLGNYDIRKLFDAKREMFGRFGHFTGRKVTATQLESSLVSHGLATLENVSEIIAYLQSGKALTYSPKGDGMELVRNEDGTYKMRKHNFYRDLSRAMGNIMDHDGPLLTEDEGERLKQKWVQPIEDSA
ncbi:MAG: hypothetical protein AABX50_01590 [Nanoarchaeota archaeon]